MTKYNGWNNYETWNVKLWLDNDEGSYYMQREWAEGALESAEATEYLTKKDVAIQTVSECVEEFIDSYRPDLGASMFSDLLGAAISEVDTYEIASAIIEDHKDN